MSSGCIVIGTNVEGVNSIIKNNHNGFLINTQMGDIEKVFKVISGSQIDLTSIKQNAIDYISLNHSLEKLSKTELLDYDELLKVNS